MQGACRAQRGKQRHSESKSGRRERARMTIIRFALEELVGHGNRSGGHQQKRMVQIRPVNLSSKPGPRVPEASKRCAIKNLWVKHLHVGSLTEKFTRNRLVLTCSGKSTWIIFLHPWKRFEGFSYNFPTLANLPV